MSVFECMCVCKHLCFFISACDYFPDSFHRVLRWFEDENRIGNESFANKME